MVRFFIYKKRIKNDKYHFNSIREKSMHKKFIREFAVCIKSTLISSITCAAAKHRNTL